MTDKKLNILNHEHKLEFLYADNTESVFGCVLPGCDFQHPEPEDCGTGA